MSAHLGVPTTPDTERQLRLAILEPDRTKAETALRRAFDPIVAKKALHLFYDGPESAVARNFFGSVAACDAAQEAMAQEVLAQCVARAAPQGVPGGHRGAIVVGAGMAGLHVAAELRAGGTDVLSLEQSEHVGGVWRLYANPTSRVNSSEPAYRMLPGVKWTNHTRCSEVLRSIAMFLVQHELEVMTCCECTKIEAGAHGDRRVHAMRHGEPVTFTTPLAALCTNRRLGVPRTVPMRGVEGFKGTILRGLYGDTQGHDFADAQVVVVGMGAFAIESMRTALEGGAAKVAFLCRRRGVVCPHIVDWANFVRPMDEAFRRSTTGDAVVLSYWNRMYELTKTVKPECWKEGLLKPDGHTVSVSDVYFLGTHTGHVTTHVGSVDRLEAAAVRYASGEHTIPATHVISCVGFETNCRNKVICGTPHMRAIGMVDAGLWLSLESHFDSGALSGVFGSSYISYLQFVSKLIATAHKVPAVMQTVAAEPVDVHMDEFTTTTVMKSIDRMVASNPAIRAMLRAHVDEVRERMHSAMSPDEYISWNVALWKDAEAMLGKALPVYPFHEFWVDLDVVDRDVVEVTQPPDIKCQSSGDLDAVLELLRGVTMQPAEADTRFSDMGLDSIANMEFRAALERQFLCRLPVTILFDVSTPREMATRLCKNNDAPQRNISAPANLNAPAPAPAPAPPAHAPSAAAPQLKRLATAGDAGVPLIMMPSTWGSASHCQGLAKHLPCPAWAVTHAYILSGALEHLAHATLLEQCWDYAVLVQACATTVSLFGSSLGGAKAYKTAMCLQRLGVRVHQVVLFDPPPLGPADFGPGIPLTTVAREMVDMACQAAGVPPRPVAEDGCEFDVIVHAARALASLGHVPDSLDGIVAVHRRMQVYRHNIDLWSRERRPAHKCAPDMSVVIATCSGRRAFYERMHGREFEDSFDSLATRVTRLPDVAGEHTEVIQRICAGQHAEWTRAMVAALA